MNALRHGLDAAPGVLLPGEDPAEREALACAYREDLRPVTPEEEALVARMAEASWLVRRAEAAAYAAAEQAIAVHGPGANVLVLECEAGGHGPFLRAEGWSLRLTGRLLRLARRLTASQRDRTRAASRIAGTKPLARSPTGRKRAGAAGRPGGSSVPNPGNSAMAGNKTIAIAPGAGIATMSAGGPKGAVGMFVAGNKAIAPFTRPRPVEGNKAIARPGAARHLARAVSAVVAGLTAAPFPLAPASSNGAEQTHCPRSETG
jgi:hypothetical protein